MAKVTQAVKATLVGTTEEELGLSQQIKANFIQHAQKDETSGELYMPEEDFVNAIAPKNQDYVSELSPERKSPSPR
jgi:solute carrier family 25 aspartate/glutamate transporter 12/13